MSEDLRLVFETLKPHSLFIRYKEEVGYVVAPKCPSHLITLAVQEAIDYDNKYKGFLKGVEYKQKQLDKVTKAADVFYESLQEIIELLVPAGVDSAAANIRHLLSTLDKVANDLEAFDLEAYDRLRRKAK